MSSDFHIGLRFVFQMSSVNVPKNIAVGLPQPAGVHSAQCVNGDYEYWHYGCDGLDDRGWGCGYRTLQTLCSWVMFKQRASGKETRNVPNIEEIQAALVAMQDKPPSFVNSRQWIGSVEVGLCVDFFFDIPCKIVHVSSGRGLTEHDNALEEHFAKGGGPIMMGGDSDNASKGILGVCRNEKETFLLILDPHYFGPTPSCESLERDNFLLWRSLSTFSEGSFYNLCLPQLKN